MPVRVAYGSVALTRAAANPAAPRVERHRQAREVATAPLAPQVACVVTGLTYIIAVADYEAAEVQGRVQERVDDILPDIAKDMDRLARALSGGR